MSFPNFLSCLSPFFVSLSTQSTRLCCHSLCSRLSHSLLSICKSLYLFLSFCTTDEQRQGSTSAAWSSPWSNALCRTLFPAVLRPGVSVVLQADDCTTAVIASISVQLPYEAMQHFNEENLPQLPSPHVSHDYTFDVHFLVFPLLILFWFVFGERDPYTEN